VRPVLIYSLRKTPSKPPFSSNRLRVDSGPLVQFTTSLEPESFPCPPDAVAMQYHPRGHPKTGLKTRCAAFARWLVEVDPGQIARKIGHVPPRDLRALAEILDRLSPIDDGREV